MRKVLCFLFILCFLSGEVFCLTRGPMAFSFEAGKGGWMVPIWSKHKKDHVADFAKITAERAVGGEKSLEIMCRFPGDKWTAALVEYEGDMDLSGCEKISADVFLPEEAETNLIQARLILTTGDWEFVESKKPVILEPGEWTRVSAPLDLEPVKESWYWKFEKGGFSDKLKNVRKIAVRIEYDTGKWTGPSYEGPLYIDNVIVR